MIKLVEAERQIKPGRALFATVGLRRVFDAKPLHITQAQFKEAVQLEPRIYEAIGEFLEGKREAVDLPEDNMAETEALLFQELAPETAAEKLLPFHGSPSGDDFAQIAGAAKAYLASKVPRRLRMVPAFGQAPRAAKPSRAELITFRRHLAAVEDPVWAIRQLLAATLGRDHIEALQAVWPDALEAARTAATGGVADRVERDLAYAMPRRIARQLAVLLGTPAVPNEFVQLLQQAFANEQKDPQAGLKQPTPPPDNDLETIVQRDADQR